MDAGKKSIKALAFLLRKHRAPTDDLSSSVVAAQQALLYKQLLPLAALPIATSTLMSICLLTVHTVLPVLMWYLAYICLPITLYLMYTRNAKKEKRASTDISMPVNVTGSLSRFAESISLISGVFWGSTTPLFGYGNEDLLIFIAVVLIFHACGFALLMGALPRMVFRFTALTLIPMSLILILEQNVLLIALGLLGLATFASIIVSSFTSYRQLQALTASELRSRRMEALLRSSVDAMPDAFAVYDFKGDIILENANHKDWSLNYAVPTTQSGERISQPTDDRWIKHSWNLVPQLGTLTIHTDITPQKHREALLIEAREQAQRARGAQSRFLSRVSHELRTPLNSVLGFSEMLGQAASRKQSWHTIEEYSNFIQSSGQHLLSLLNDLLDYTNIGEDADQLRVQTVDLSDLVKRAVTLARTRAATESRHKVLLRLNKDLRHIKTDPHLLERILTNIISNSIKFSEADSKIAISTNLAETGYLQIIIRDFGHGMTSEQIENAFSAFYQVDDTHQRTSEGTGMGLALVKKLASLIKADVKIHSKPGHGTAVIVSLGPETALVSAHDEDDEDATKNVA